MEALELCLDTDVVIEFLKDQSSAASKLIRESRDRVRFFVTSITVYELIYGPSYGGYEKELDDVRTFLLWVTVLPLDAESARIAAEIDAMLHKKGKLVGLRDVFIAAICCRNEIPLVTRNVSHFNLITKETRCKLEIFTPEEALQMLP
ncbi:MAG: type II toxin-antitoxin system VapC family toxin [Candidatus Njordarchaeales archaeon]